VSLGDCFADSAIECLRFARHAESADPSVFHGYESDIDLGPEGMRQAALFSRRPDLASVDLLISSGQTRSLNTLKPLSQVLGLPIQIISSFHERKVGILQGTPTMGNNSPFARTRLEWSQGNKNYTTEGAESYQEVRDRVFRALGQLRSLCDHTGAKNPLVVSHGLTLKVLFLEWIHQGDTTHWDGLGPIQNTALWEVPRPFHQPRLKGCKRHLETVSG